MARSSGRGSVERDRCEGDGLEDLYWQCFDMLLRGATDWANVMNRADLPALKRALE